MDQRPQFQPKQHTALLQQVVAVLLIVTMTALYIVSLPSLGFQWITFVAALVVIGMLVVQLLRIRSGSSGKLDRFVPLEQLYAMNPFDFEKHVADRFQKLGYEKVRVTDDMADGGIDVLMEKNGHRIGVQVKRYWKKKYVQVESVRALLGSMQQMGLDKVIFVTTSQFTRYVWETIKRDQIFLINGKKFEELSKAADKGRRNEVVRMLERFCG